MKTNRINSEQMLADMIAATANMSEDMAAHAVVVEGAPNDDALMGGLFRLAVNGRLSVDAYSVMYATTNSMGVFFNSRSRLVAARMLRAFNR